MIDSYIKMCNIPNIFLGKLVGRLPFSLTSVFGEIPRTPMRPLYQEFRRRAPNAHLPNHERCALEWRSRIGADFTPRIAVDRPPIAGGVIYTDSASDTPAICALLLDGKSRRPQRMKECDARAPTT